MGVPVPAVALVGAAVAVFSEAEALVRAGGRAAAGSSPLCPQSR